MGRQQGLSAGLAGVVARELNARGHRTLTAKSVATGIKRSTLDRRLKAEQAFDAEQLARIANAIGWKLSDLVGAGEDAAA